METTERGIIDQADSAFDQEHSDLLSALESFQMNGCPDEQSGDVECFMHFYRVDRWIVTTDSQGFREVLPFNTESEARFNFNELEREYSDHLPMEDS